MSLTADKIIHAASTLEGVVHITPLDYSRTFSAMVGCNVFFKAENMQKTGSFKIRGAYYKMALLSQEQRQKGVITASAGNHGQGVAYAAARAGIGATVVMPVNAPIAKVEATREYGAQTVLAGQDYDEAYARAMELQAHTGATFIHGFEDPDVIAGQGTIGLEIIKQLPQVGAVLVPVGGGGLIAGVALAVKSARPDIKVFGVQSETAPAMCLSLHAGCWREAPGHPCTLADGIAVRRPGRLNFDLIKSYVDEMVTVQDEEIARAITLLLERSKMVVEGAGAVGLAALLQKKVDIQEGNAVVVLSGGNIDINTISNLIERGLIKSGRRVYLRAVVDDRPGALQNMLSLVAGLHANIIKISHSRDNPKVPLQKAEVRLLLETRNLEHVQDIINLLRSCNYEII